MSGLIGIVLEANVLGLFDIFHKKETEEVFSDASTIPENEKKYYQPDEYYASTSYPGSMMERQVITFEERKKICTPSRRGLYVAEILLLHYCEKGEYPNPKSGYPGFWWFQYGIRDVGGALRSLERRGFIAMDSQTEKYKLTEKGRFELAGNGYIPYMHNEKRTTVEGGMFGKEFNVWSINRIVAENLEAKWEDIVKAEKKEMIDEFLLKPGGKDVHNNLTGEALEKVGRVDEAVKLYEENIAARFPGSFPYNRLAIIYRKKKDYDNEIRVLERAVDVYENSGFSDPPKLEKFQERLERAKELKRKSQGLGKTEH